MKDSNFEPRIKFGTLLVAHINLIHQHLEHNVSASGVLCKAEVHQSIDNQQSKTKFCPRI